jgi:hypothetical protein
MVVLCTTSQLLLFALAMALVDVVAGVTGTPILVEAGTEVVILGSVHPRLFGVVLIDLLLYGGGRLLRAGQLDRLREWRLDEDAADLDAALFSSTRAGATRR